MKNNNQKIWETHLKNWKESGLSQAEYCRQNGMNKDTFGKWKKRLMQEAAGNRFVEIAVMGVRKDQV